MLVVTRSCLRVITLVLLLVVLLLITLMFFAGRWLSTADTPQSADVIIVLAGTPERAIYAGDLYHQRYAPVVLISRPAKENSQILLEQLGIAQESQEELNRRILLAKGVPAAHIGFFGNSSLSTFDEAQALRAQLSPARRRFLIVTSPYHARRVKLVFSRALRDIDVSVSVVTGPYEPDVEYWWRTQEGARNVLLESAKIFFYLIGGRFASSGQ